MARRSNKPFFKNNGIFFFAVILIILILNIIIPDRSFSDKENRVLSSFPPFNAKEMLEGREEPKYETYVNDQFLLRDAWISLKAGVDRLMGKVESNGVWLCKDGYLMEAFTPPSEDALDEMLTALQNFSARHSDLHQSMMIIPNAVNITSFRLPAGAQVTDQNPYIDRVKSSVKENGVSFIDVRDSLSGHSNEKIYYKTDHHWTTLGAYYTYLAAADSLSLDTSILTYDQLPVSLSFQGTLSARSGFRSGEKEEMYVFLPRNDTAPEFVVNYVTEREKTASYYKTERLDTRDKYAMFFDGNHAQVKITTPTAEDRTLLIFKDSYANCFVPFLAPHYRNIILIDPRYYYGSIDDVIASENVGEILYLYNANTFFTDTSLALTLNGDESSIDTSGMADGDGSNESGSLTDTEGSGTGTEGTEGTETGSASADGTSGAGTEGTTTESSSDGSDTTDGGTDYDESYDDSYDYDSYYDDSYYDESYYDESYYDESYDYDSDYDY
ncbi:MAG: hypothetical protein IJ123_09035 [Blautia sp.]|nr:hypothetical protein [Blautia sp.]